MEAGALAGRERLQRRGVALEWFTVTWNVAEALVAIAAGVAAGSIALIGFGVDSGIEVVAASALLWRFRQAKAHASAEEHGKAERRALHVVSATFFALAAYIAFEAIHGLASQEQPDTSTVGLILALVSLAVMPTLPLTRAPPRDRPAQHPRLVVGGSHRSARHAARDRLARMGDARRGPRAAGRTGVAPTQPWRSRCGAPDIAGRRLPGRLIHDNRARGIACAGA